MAKKCKLSELCDVRDGTHDSPEYVQEGYPLVTSKNIVDGRLDLTVVNFISEKDYKHINERSKVDLGDIIMPMIGTIGNPHLIDVIPEFAIKNVALIKFPKSDVSNKFIYYFLQSDAFKTYVAENNRGGTQKFLSLKDIRNMDIPALPYEKQLEICVVMDKVSELIALRKEQLAKLDQLVKSRFIELFGGLERTTTIARYISELRGGKSLAGTEPCKNKVLKTGAATFGWFDPEQYKYLPTDYEPLPEHKVETGDVIISRMNTPELVGACSYVFDAPEDMYYPDRLWKAVLKENTNPIFLWQLLWDRDIRKAIKESSGGTSGTMHNISKANLLAIKCMDAPIELQNEYAEFVKQTDKSKSAIQASLDKLELLKKSLMQQYFG